MSKCNLSEKACGHPKRCCWACSIYSKCAHRHRCENDVGKCGAVDREEKKVCT